MNTIGLKGKDLYKEIMEFFDSEDYQSELNKDDYVQSVINANFNTAKIYSKLYPAKMSDRMEFLILSLKHYNFIREYIRKTGENQGAINFDFSQQLKLTLEMCELLPVKISKLSQGLLK